MIYSSDLDNSLTSRHFSLLNVNAAGACGYDFPCDGGRLVRAIFETKTRGDMKNYLVKTTNSPTKTN